MHTTFTTHTLYTIAAPGRSSYRPKMYPAVILATALVLSIFSPVASRACASCGKEQKFYITGYYSPLPDQQHYIMGSYEKEIWFNGRGIRGADGTGVYPGMMAAPPEVAFGTRVSIPEIEGFAPAFVGTVHDRGGWIKMREDGSMHIDLWMGYGEEGLKRALAWGAREVTGTIYASDDPGKPQESYVLAHFPAPDDAISDIASNPITMIGIEDTVAGDTTEQVAAMQYALHKLGYFDHEVTWFYGDVTTEGVRLFQRDAQLGVDGTRADDETRAALVAHGTLAEQVNHILSGEDILVRGTHGREVRTAQRVLKLLGYYDGAATGTFDRSLSDATFRFQADRSIVQQWGNAGAGMIGPQTRRALLTALRSHKVGKQGGSMEIALQQQGGAL